MPLPQHFWGPFALLTKHIASVITVLILTVIVNGSMRPKRFLIELRLDTFTFLFSRTSHGVVTKRDVHRTFVYLLDNFQIQFLSTYLGEEIVHRSAKRVKLNKWKFLMLTEVKRVEFLISVRKYHAYHPMVQKWNTWGLENKLLITK